jgi:hypothetical protein
MPRALTAVGAVTEDPGMSGDAPQQSAPAGDQPIDDLAQDELGRDRFVEALRDEVRDAPSDGFVIGVTGDWGSGKTSVINMALNPLAKEAGFRIVRFNPWLFSGTPQLIEHFFTEVSSQLREAGRRIKGERLIHLSEAISGYADILDPLRFAPGVDAAVRAGRASAGILGRLGHKPTSAQETKAALDRLLAEHDERLVVVVDDIDRLTDLEIRDVMRLVRLVGDFPNTTYVLAYASAAVAQALGGDKEQEIGQAYLEKIVQVTHAVPAIDPEQLSLLLLGRLESALAGLSYELDREHWSSIYTGIRPYFRTMRDVLRWVNAVRSPVRGLVAELDVADILGLEALRIFEPAVWERIDGLAEALTKPGDHYFVNTDRDAADEQVRGLLPVAARPEQARDLLRGLFPVAQRALGRSNYGSDFMGAWRRQGRVAHIENLRVYLARQVSAKGAPRDLVLQTVAALPDADAARAIFAETADEQLPALLSRLGDYADDLPITAAASIPVLFELRPRLPERGGGFFDIDPEIRIGSVIVRVFMGSRLEEVAASVDHVLPDIALLSDRFSLLRALGWRSESPEKLCADEDLERQADTVVQEALTRSGQRLADEHELATLVYYVREARSAEVVSEWARERATCALFILSVIASSFREVRNTTGRHVQLLWDSLVDLLGEQTLLDVIARLPADGAWPRALTRDETELLRQARICADDPQHAQQTMAAYRRRYPS